MTSNEEDSEQPAGWAAVGRKDVFICVLCGLAVALTVNHFSGFGRGRAAGICVLVDILVIKLRWNLKGKLGSWFAITLNLMLQTILIYFVSFGDEWMSSYALLSAALVIYLVDECLIFLLTREFAPRPR